MRTDSLFRAAGYDFGGYLLSSDNKQGTSYPSREHRRAAAQAYIDAVGPEECSKWTRNTADEVVYDMEKGMVMRLLWFATVSRWFIGPWFVPACVDVIKKCLANFEAAEARASQGDDTHVVDIQERGVTKSAKGTSILALVCRCICCCYCCRYK